jgi:DNA polymerase-2
MERFVKGGFRVRGTPRQTQGYIEFSNPSIRGCDCDIPLSTLSLDIETNAAAGTLYSIACAGRTQRVFIIGTGNDTGQITFVPDERALLRAFLRHLADEDPDCLIGWNVIEFDLLILQNRCRALNVPFTCGRGGSTGAVYEKHANPAQHHVRIPGRVVMDVPVMLRANYYSFEEYSLDHVAHEMLGKGKTITATGEEKISEINRLFRDDAGALARYNLTDATLTKEIFETAGILPNSVERSKLSGLLLDRLGGSVAAFDYLYLPLLHRAGYIAPSRAAERDSTVSLSGGYVMEPAPGLYRNVVVLDFKSLYPSIIMTFKIDPLGMISRSPNRIHGPHGPSFAVDETLLPDIIDNLMAARARAKENKNQYLSQAIKIIMNSFYGVLGTPACRFFSIDLAQTITDSGRYILKETIRHIEESTPYKVIYGDTDSLFVHLGEGHDSDAGVVAKDIAAEVNEWLTAHLSKHFGVESALELEYETHFLDFLMPTTRGGMQGSKKHYCGTVQGPEGLQLSFTGMESVRSDWTELAKTFQRELVMRLFEKRPVEDYIIETVRRLKKGEFDSRCTYRKRIRKGLDEYTTHVPPHIQAARQLDSAGHSVRYCITTEGPQPIEKRSAPLDYDHYIDSQLRPIADTILNWLDLDFDTILSGQQSLF